ncbi:MAG TPA: primosomal protein N' [Casimicrobiaceae bacterium]|nr:primosomal protein N' [Casimicrobiaceae bacterium]
MSIARVALPVAAWQLFDYWIPDGLAVHDGDVVRARLGRRSLTGVVVAVDASTAFLDRLQPIDAVTTARLPADVMELAAFVSAYYQAPLGMTHALVAPPPARVRQPRKPPPAAAEDPRATPSLNDPQTRAVAAIAAAHATFSPLLLHGVTGSGKTAVYLAAAARSIQAGGQVLILVPEINLTPQLEQRVQAALSGVRMVTLHSRLAAGVRREHWDAAANGSAQVVLGTRLGVFAPLPNLALVVVDEEHDDSYKQQDGVRYHARDLALWRARRRNVPIVLGSATPSLETWARARAGRYRLLSLGERADVRARMPVIRFAPSRGGDVRDALSAPLRDALERTLDAREQALLFINRRGYAPSLKCAACAWQSECPRCSARLVLHRAPDRLRCHHCAHAAPAPRACPECGNVDLLPSGFGTQRLEQAIRTAFPTARVLRVDRDTTRNKDAFAAMREQVDAHDVDILVGTQMLAKGHDFPRLTLVGVLGADNALYSADFRATERLVALLTQVAGRAGRAELPGSVIVQTDFAEHPAYRALAAHDYAGFADHLLAERRAAELPPASRIALLLAEAHARNDVDRFLEDAVEHARALLATDRSVHVFPPVPPALARRIGFERGQVLVQSTRRASLQSFLPRWREALATVGSTRVRWAIDVDPTAF